MLKWWSRRRDKGHLEGIQWSRLSLLWTINQIKQVIKPQKRIINKFAITIFIQIQKKAYNSLDFLAAGLMCFGLMVFMLADSKVSFYFFHNILISLDGIRTHDHLESCPHAEWVCFVSTSLFLMLDSV